MQSPFAVPSRMKYYEDVVVGFQLEMPLHLHFANIRYLSDCISYTGPLIHQQHPHHRRSVFGMLYFLNMKLNTREPPWEKTWRVLFTKYDELVIGPTDFYGVLGWNPMQIHNFSPSENKFLVDLRDKTGFP